MKRRSRFFKWGIWMLAALLLVVGVSSLFGHDHRRGGMQANGRAYHGQYQTQNGGQYQAYHSRGGQAGFQRGDDSKSNAYNNEHFRNSEHRSGGWGWLGLLGTFLVTILVLPLLIPLVGLVIAIVLIALLMKRLRRNRPLATEFTSTYTTAAPDFLDQWEKETRAKQNKNTKEDL